MVQERSNIFDIDKLASYENRVFLKKISRHKNLATSALHVGGSTASSVSSSSTFAAAGSAGYVIDSDSLDDDATLLVELFSSLIEAARNNKEQRNKRGDERHLSTQSTDTSSSLIESEERHLVSLISYIFSELSNDYVCPLSLLTSLMLKGSSSSSVVINTVGKLLPGGVSSTYIQQRIKETVDRAFSATRRDESSLVTKLTFDNCGFYKEKSSGGGVESKNIIPVWCNCIEYRCFIDANANSAATPLPGW
jgi:hypothetical protein